MHLLDLIFPKHCVSCGRFGRYICESCRKNIKVIEERETVCPVCEKPAMMGLTHPYCRTRYGIDGLTSFFHYDGPVRHCIQQIKYKFVSDLVSSFVSQIPDASINELTNLRINPARHRYARLPFGLSRQAIAGQAQALTGGELTNLRSSDTVVIPIPLHSYRLRHRGFNQSEKLSECLSKRMSLPVEKNILKRSKYTRPQVEKKTRAERMKHMEDIFRVDPKKIEGIHGVFLVDDVCTTGATLRSAARTLKKAGIPWVWGVTMAR